MNSQSNYYLQALEPFLEMLKDKESELPRSEWEQLVLSTKERIILVPEQYLSHTVKPSEELRIAIDTMFNERFN
jgi:hypothetical protein